MQAQTTTKVEFITSQDGKTLTISGQGDLTNYTMADPSAKLFTSKAVGNVSKQDNSYGNVKEGDSYDFTQNYYSASREYTALFESNGNLPIAQKNNFNEVSITNAKWKKDADLSNLYVITNNNGQYLTIGDKADASQDVTTEIWSYGDYSYQAMYIVSSTDISNQTLDVTTLESNGYQALTLGKFLTTYTTFNMTYSVWDDKNTLFVKHQGYTDYTALSKDNTYKYQEGDVFYKGETTYSLISDNAAFFSEHTDYLEQDPAEVAFSKVLANKLKEGVTFSNTPATNSFETIKFVNTDTNEPLVIDKAIVRTILYNEYTSPNRNTQTLDMGEATINDLSKAIFMPSDDNEWPNIADMALVNVTLPLTQKSTVTIQGSDNTEQRMVVPSNVTLPLVEHLKTITIPDGYEHIGDNAFLNMKVVKEVKLPSTLLRIGDYAFKGCSALADITFPEGLVNIGKGAFAENQALTKINFPSSLRIINDEAFVSTNNLTNLQFNEGLIFIGNSAFARDNNDVPEPVGTLEIPASVKYIGPWALTQHLYQDVYFYGDKAPIMPLGTSTNSAFTGESTAFSRDMLNAEGGYDPSTGSMIGSDNTSDGYANRENYKGENGYMCILHFPQGLSDKNRATYTDISREYEALPKDGNPADTQKPGKETTPLTFQGYTASTEMNYGYKDTYLGEQYVWPSIGELNRSYIVNSLGYNWDGVTEYRPDLDPDELAIFKLAGYDTSAANLDYLSKIAYLGTRQYVIYNADAQQTTDDEYPIDMKGGAWWTICVPFNMTKAQVDATFGEGTHVCRFSGVDRKENNGNKTVVLKFQNDVYAHKVAKDAEGNYPTARGTEAVADDDIVIYAHESYMIYPTKNEEATFYVKDYTLEPGSPLPTIIEANADDTKATDHTKYRFIGNYQTALTTTNSETKTVTIPQYSYMYNKKKTEAAYKFWFYTGNTMAWKSNKSVVQLAERNDDGTNKDYEELFKEENTNVTSAKVNQQSIFGDSDDSTTGVDKVTIIAGEGKNAQVVYNLNGQLVSNNGNNLPKGIYIKNGKKYMVK